MSNNVLWIVDGRNCRRLPIAKYFPTGGWEVLPTDKELQHWLNAGEATVLSCGNTSFALVFDTIEPECIEPEK